MWQAVAPRRSQPPRRILFVSNLFPSSAEPGRGRFNLDQLVALRKVGIDTTVVAPLLWLFGLRTRSTARLAVAPDREEIDGFPVLHPKVPYVPLWRGAINGLLYGLAIWRACRTSARTFAPDLMWASFGFPDAVGAAMVARRLGLPFVATVHGSDVNVSFGMPARRRAMLDALRSARFVFSRSARMRETLVDAGLDPDRVVTVYNGVDRAAFHPRPRDEAARALGVDARQRRVLFVGNLVAVKGVADLLAAHCRVRRDTGAQLVVVGDGDREAKLREQVQAADLEDAVVFAGRESRNRVSQWLAASDVLALPSHTEGVPNVVLEAFACGRPVVATRVGGVPEVHPGERAGALVAPGDPNRLAEALVGVLSRPWDEGDLAALVERFSWTASSARMLQALRELAADGEPWDRAATVAAGS